MKSTVHSVVETIRNNESPCCIELERYLLSLKRDELVDSAEVLKKIKRTEHAIRPSRLPARFAMYRHKVCHTDPMDGKQKVVVWWGRPEAIEKLKKQLEEINREGNLEVDHR